MIRRLMLLTVVVGLLVSAKALLAADPSAVKVWETKIVIPTYLAGDPEPNPMFFFGRESQGSQGPVYPYPMYDSLTGKKVDKTYTIVYLENEYIRIGVLPEIGGRLFEGVDKTNGYNFIYRQHVIKPALIGLIGAWISGGIEWDVPFHHRASTFLPVQYKTEENADGSKTIWVGELEPRQRMRWAVGYTLRPAKAYLEAQVRILNRTPVGNTMLLFANLAISANDSYQIIYPPSRQFGVFHAKREFTDWPISHQLYAGDDFTKGVDISWYKNHVGASSVLAWNYQEDFFAGYDCFADCRRRPGRCHQDDVSAHVCGGRRREPECVGALDGCTHPAGANGDPGQALWGCPGGSAGRRNNSDEPAHERGLWQQRRQPALCRDRLLDGRCLQGLRRHAEGR